jgi:ferrous iron transport protein B
MHTHAITQNTFMNSEGSIALVGHPNVGKSVIFQQLTGQHATVSNYPGTTVEVMRGVSRSLFKTIIVDTPGVITFPPISEDEMVTAKVLLQEPLRAIVQVGDAKNLRRTMLLTTQLAEMERPLVLALNMQDEAIQRGVKVNYHLLTEHLTLPVIPTTAIRGQGIDLLTEAIISLSHPHFRINYPVDIEGFLASFCTRISKSPISARSLGLAWLSGDATVDEWLNENITSPVYQELVSLRDDLQLKNVETLSSIIQQTRLEVVERIVHSTMVQSDAAPRTFVNKLSHLTTHPIWGIPILALVLYVIYWFVGVLGAQTVVDFLEEDFFEGLLNPWITGLVEGAIPISIITDFLVGDYGLWTMGMTYALALILPIVTFFFLAFGVLEDSGYLPRLAALSNRFFRLLGLNGKAVLPMVLGLGCVTMATVTARILENKRERVLVTLLLALAIPCSAQLGVVLGLLAGISLGATLIWSAVVFIVLMVVGWLAARLMPGDRTPLMVELPPLRLPVISNVFIKTLARLEWYLKEVIPLFLIGTAFMFFLDRLGILGGIIQLSEPLVVGWLGLPAETSAAFIMGFLRRDFGAAGLFFMSSQGMLTPIQLVVSMVTITLFIPCIASVFVIAKERSKKAAASIVLLVFPLALLVGGVLYRILMIVGWGS